MDQTIQLVLLAAMVGGFWFLIMRPQQQRARQQREMLAELEPGDQIVTIGGIFGTVVETGDRIRVRTVDGSELEVAPQAIANLVPTDTQEPADADDSAEAPLDALSTEGHDAEGTDSDA